VGAANRDPRLAQVFTTYTASTPLFELELDRERAQAQGVDLASLYRTVQILLGSQYVNDFDETNRSFRVYVQADQQFRRDPGQLGSFYVRNAAGQMIPLDGLMRLTPRTTAQNVSHYNLFRSAEVLGSAAPGQSAGAAMAAMEAQAQKTLPAGYAFEWTGASREQQEAGGQTLLLFALAVLFVFLLLAGLYESFWLPLTIIFSVPVAILGGLALVGLRGLVNDVFCQVGLVLLVALASKNAILIVEFAERLGREGKGLTQAVVQASTLRLRPILMTSLALILGVLPLALASGAGAAARQSLGTVVFGGLLVSTFVNLVYIPVLYVVMTRLRGAMRRKPAGALPA
jgi:HAE1 family hydrophobic/amphiphilic exporter-1